MGNAVTGFKSNKKNKKSEYKKNKNKNVIK